MIHACNYARRGRSNPSPYVRQFSWSANAAGRVGDTSDHSQCVHHNRSRFFTQASLCSHFLPRVSCTNSATALDMTPFCRPSIVPSLFSLTFVLDAFAFHCTDLHGVCIILCHYGSVDVRDSYRPPANGSNLLADMVVSCGLTPSCKSRATNSCLCWSCGSMLVTYSNLGHSLSNSTWDSVYTAADSSNPRLSNSLAGPTPGQHVTGPPGIHQRPSCMARHEQEVQRRVAVLLWATVQALVRDKSFRRRWRSSASCVTGRCAAT